MTNLTAIQDAVDLIQFNLDIIQTELDTPDPVPTPVPEPTPTPTPTPTPEPVRNPPTILSIAP